MRFMIYSMFALLVGLQAFNVGCAGNKAAKKDETTEAINAYRACKNSYAIRGQDSAICDQVRVGNCPSVADFRMWSGNGTQTGYNPIGNTGYNGFNNGYNSIYNNGYNSGYNNGYNYQNQYSAYDNQIISNYFATVGTCFYETDVRTLEVTWIDLSRQAAYPRY